MLPLFISSAKAPPAFNMSQPSVTLGSMADATDGQVSRRATLRSNHAMTAAKPSRIPWRPILIVCLLILIGVAARFDASTAAWAFQEKLPPILKHSIWASIIKLPGNYLKGTLPIALPLAALVCIFSGPRRAGYAASLILLSGVLAGLFYTLAKWCAGRTRPYSRGPTAHPFEFHPFAQGISGLWTANDQAFPSGHTCLAFSTATALALLWPRAAPLFFVWPILIGIERVLENAHYPSDVIAGALFGMMAAWSAEWLLRLLAPSADTNPGVAHA